MKRGRPLDYFVEKPGRNPDRERSIKAVYDQLVELSRAGAYLAKTTHRGSSLSRLKRVGASLIKFRKLLEHKSLKMTEICGRVKDIHPFRLEKQHPLLDGIGFRNQCCDRIINAILRKAKCYRSC